MRQISQQIFIDASALTAFIDRADPNHIRCARVFEFLAQHQFKLYTSNLVIIQTFGRLEKDLGFAISREFLSVCLESNIQILSPTEADLESAARFLKLNPERQVSLMEIVNAHLMDKNHIPAILTFDYWHNLMGTTITRLLNS